MFSAIKSFPIPTKATVSTLVFATSNSFPPKAVIPSSVRFQQQASSAGNQQQTTDNMDKKEDPKQQLHQNKGDAMSDSFGEGYATRSDEEGFGGTCGGKQSLSNEDEDNKILHANSAEYDKTQGSEVKEKEKSRHQTQAN